MKATHTIGLFIAAIALMGMSDAGSLDFEDLTAGTSYLYGATFNTDTTTVTIGEFQYSDGTWTTNGQAVVETGGMAGGSGNELALFNVNASFDFGEPSSMIALGYGEYGGNMNLEINGDFRNFENFEDIHTSIIGGAVVNVLATSGTPGHGTGVVQFMPAMTTIDSFAVGGQEFWIDNVEAVGPMQPICFVGAAD